MFNRKNKVKSKNNQGIIVSGDGNKIVNLLVKLVHPQSKGDVVTAIALWFGLIASFIAIVQFVPQLQNWLSPSSPFWLDSEQGVYQRQESPASFTQLALPLAHNKAQTPFELLGWQRRLTGLIGRDQELRRLSDWAQSEPVLSLMLISGGAGTGKTRLAIALAEQLQQSGWQAGLFDLAGKLPIQLQEQGNLLILDDPEQHPQALTRLLSALARQQPDYRLRILLVSRRDASVWRDKLDSLGLVLFAEVPLQALSQIDSYLLFTQAREHAARILHYQTPTTISAEHFQLWLKSSPEQYRLPLHLIATALNSLDQPAWEQLTGIQVIQTLVRQEQARLRRLALARGWEENSLIRLQMLAIIAQGLDAQAILNLARQPQLELGLPQQALLDELQNLGVYSAQSIAPIKPDIVAAAWTANVFEKRPDLAATWLGAALEQAADIPQALQSLANLILDTRHTVHATWHDDWLTELAKGQPERCKRFSKGLNVNYLATNLTPLSIACTRNLLTQTKSQPEQARLLRNLSGHLAQSGDRTAGLIAIQRAVKIHEALANTSFVAYGSDLALSLITLSNRLIESGDHSAGLTAIQRAVEIYEQLANTNFTAYGPDLAMSLNNLSIHLAESGGHAAGLTAIQHAVEIREQLAKTNVAAYGPILASSLNNLSIHLADSGNRAAALTTIQRAVEIFEGLVKTNFAAYGPDLAISLKTLSNRLAENGDRAAALTAIQRAVEINKQLAKTNFATYGPNLAGSLNNLSIGLSGSGDRAAALTAIQRAVEINKQLAKTNFATYGPDLAISLNSLSNRLAKSGNRATSLTAIQRAVGIRETLANANFTAYGPALANSLNNLSNRLAESGNSAAGLTAIQRAVKIYEQLANTDFAAYWPDLAISLNTLSIRLAENDDLAAGLTVIQRAVEIYEGLVRENPAVFEPKLAGSLANLADYWAQSAKVTNAVEIVQRAIRLITPYAIEGTTYADWLITMKQNLAKYQALE